MFDVTTDWIVAPFVARDFYLRVAKARHTRQPDSLERNKRAVVIEGFGGGPRVLSDGSRRVEVYPMTTSHADDNVVIYLPADRMVIEADHISPRGGQVRPTPMVREFVAGLDKLNLDVATIVGIHGDSVSMQATRCRPRRKEIANNLTDDKDVSRSRRIHKRKQAGGKLYSPEF
jgi:glyoxylase-like metal-dependent hydrolase (beta-lactamase superfamily II)